MKWQDLKNIKLTKEQQNAIGLSVLIVVGGGYGYINYLYKPKVIKIAELRKTLAEEEDVLNKTLESVHNIDKFRRDSEETIRKLRWIKDRLPDEDRVPEVMRGITKALKMSGVNLNQFFQPPGQEQVVVGANYREISTQIMITTDYRSLASFLTELSRVPRLVSCSSIRLVKSEDPAIPGSLKAQLGIKSYIYGGGAPAKKK